MGFSLSKLVCGRSAPADWIGVRRRVIQMRRRKMEVILEDMVWLVVIWIGGAYMQKCAIFSFPVYFGQFL